MASITRGHFWTLSLIACVTSSSVSWLPELPHRKSNYPATENIWGNPDSIGSSWAQPASQCCQGARQVSEAILGTPVQSSHQLNTIEGPWPVSHGAEFAHQLLFEFPTHKIFVTNKNTSLVSEFQALNLSAATFWLVWPEANADPPCTLVPTSMQLR